MIDHAVGYNFLAELGWADPTGLGLESTPVFTELASYVANNIWIAFIILFGFIFWSYAWLPGQILNGSRNIFAYSLDGLLPKWFKQVNPRYSDAGELAAHDGHRQHHRSGHLRVHRPVLDPGRHLRLHPQLHRHLDRRGGAAVPAQGRVRDVGREPAHRRASR